MKNDDIFKALTEIDDDIIDEGDKDKAKNHFIKWCGIAASFFVLFLAGIVWFASQSDENKIETYNKETTTTTVQTTTTQATTTTVQTTTTQATTSIPEDLVRPPVFPDDVAFDVVTFMEMESYDKLRQFQEIYFSDYTYYLPEINEENYTITKHSVVDCYIGYYFFTVESNDGDVCVIYSESIEEPTTYEEFKEYYIENFKGAEDIYDDENGIIYANDPWTPGSDYVIHYVTDNGAQITFMSENDHNAEEIKAKFDEFMSAVIED